MTFTRFLWLVAFSVAALALFGCGAEPPAVEEPEPQERASPHETTSAMVGEANISITYGRPYKKGREIYGGLVPFDAVWRTGADEATTLESDRDLMFGDLHVPAGKYGLFTMPSAESWTLILNKVADQWGAFDYSDAEDLGRVEMAVSEPAEITEQLTISIEPGEGSDAMLRITWDMTTASVAFMAH